MGAMGIAVTIVGSFLLITTTIIASTLYFRSKKFDQKQAEKDSIVYKFQPNENEHSLDELVEYHKDKKVQYDKALKSGDKELIKKSKPVNYKVEEEMEM